MHYELSENQINFLGFSQCFGVIWNVRADSAPPLSSNIQKPRPIRVKIHEINYFSITKRMQMDFAQLLVMLLTEKVVKLTVLIELLSKRQDGPSREKTLQ